VSTYRDNPDSPWRSPICLHVVHLTCKQVLDKLATVSYTSASISYDSTCKHMEITNEAYR